jgi:hypothetical protein
VHALCQVTLSSDSTWRELVRRDFASNQLQMKRWTAELAAKAMADAAAAGASTVSSVASTATAAATAELLFGAFIAGAVEPGSTLVAPPVSRSLTKDAGVGYKNEWKRLYASL